MGCRVTGIVLMYSVLAEVGDINALGAGLINQGFDQVMRAFVALVADGTPESASCHSRVPCGSISTDDDELLMFSFAADMLPPPCNGYDVRTRDDQLQDISTRNGL